MIMVLVLQAATDPQALIAQLDDESWPVREAATEALLVVDAVPMEVIETAMTREDLSPEQHARLARIAIARFRATPMGGLGVSFGAAGDAGVQIQGVVPGFPAADMLRAQDSILAIGDVVVRGQDHVRAEILSRGPGETLPVLLRRERTVVEMELPLGSYDRLDAAAALDDATVLRAMRLRYGRRAAQPAEMDVIGTGLGMDAWTRTAFPDDVENAPTGDRRGPGVAIGRAGQTRELAGMRRGFWGSLADAELGIREQRRADLGRRLTTAVRARSVLVEFQRALDERLRRAAETGEDDAALRERAERLGEQLRRLDQSMAEMAARIDDP